MRTTFDRVSGLSADQRAALADQFEKAARIAGAEPVAVVGIGCRLPGGAVGSDGYWRFLAEGRDAITEVPPDRWDADAFYDADPLVPGRMPSKWGGFLPDIAGFDAEFFGISPREAAAMDPQQRLLLEVAWEALEHTGIAPDRLSGTRTAVMMGVYYNEYQSASAGNPDGIDAYSATGNAHSVTVGRIAYLLGLRGPAVAVDTACSSSLVSVHLACQSLRMRESDVALAGGVNLILRPETQLALAKWGMLSPRGHCHTFDAAADGFVRGEGAAVVVLKRLTDAVAAGDRVLAVVRGSAVNQDGRSNGLTAPNALAQRDVINRALWSADVAAGSVDFVETHGTGTALGDPIEFDALAEVYGAGDAPCALGAVKTNMGHLEAAAGIAGFVKAVLAIERGQIPPNLHFTQWNPAIDPTSTRLFVPTEITAWPQRDGPRRAAVSSFGLGGTNAHVVLEQGPDEVAVGAPGPAVATLVVSGKSAQRVASSAGVLADWLDGAGAGAMLPDVAHTLDRLRLRQNRYATVCARDRAGAVAGLRAVAAGAPAPGVVPAHEGVSGPGTVFVYSGQGSQWAGMGRLLLADEPAFAAAVSDLEPIFVEAAGFSLQQVLAGGQQVVGIDRIQPVLVGIQLALTRLWDSHGVHPDAVIGHSMGEVSAAVVAGALTPAEGLHVIATRSRLMKRLAGQGAMALLELDADTTATVIAEHPDIAIAVYASPRQTVIAGPPEQVDDIIATVDARGRLARRVEVDVASHHRTVDPILPELHAALTGLHPRPPAIPIITTTTGRTPAAPARYDADHWVANLRDPVHFTHAITTAATTHHTFIEVSPHPLLTHAITDTLETAGRGGAVRAAGTLTRDGDDTVGFHTQLATVRPPSEPPPSPDGAARLVALPPTAWQHTRYWMADRPSNHAADGSHPLLGFHVELPSGSGHVWQADIGTRTHPWLADHRVHGQPVMPAAAFAEMALAAASQALNLSTAGVRVHRLEVEQMLPLQEQTQVTTHVIPDDSNGARIEIHTRSAGGHWCRHAVAQVHETHPDATRQRYTTPDDRGTEISPADFYTAMRRTGAHHGPAFAALTRITRLPGGGTHTDITVPDEAAPHHGYQIHPVLFDAALQSLAAAVPTETLPGSTDETYLPVTVESIQTFARSGTPAHCHAELATDNHHGTGILGNITLTDHDHTAVATISGVYLRRVQRRAVPLPLQQKTFHTEWVQRSNPGAPGVASAGSWMTLWEGGDNTARAEELADALRAQSHRVVAADLTDQPAVLDAFARAAADPARPPVGVVVVAGRHSTVDGPALDGALTRGRELVWAVAATVQAIVGGWHGKPPRLWIVTHNGLAVTGTEPGDPAVGALKGLIRVLAYEHPDLHATLVDVDSAGHPIEQLTAELLSPGDDDVIAWRNGRRYVERLSRAELDCRTNDPVVRPDGAYIVSGGLGGVGMVVARWLVDRGAGRVVLNGRSHGAAEQQPGLTDVRSRGEVVVVTGDIAEPGVAERLVAAAEESGRPLRGVIHAAAVIDDQLVAGLDRGSLDRVWASKAAGALRLHHATSGTSLDWWIGFSSVASLLGSAGQVAYATANAWLDALVAWRRAAGLPATTINWGQWADVGVARSLTLSVLDPITPAEGLEALDAVLRADPTGVGVARMRIDRAAAAFPEIRQLGYFAQLADELDSLGDDEDWAGPAALRDLDSAEVHRTVTTRLRRRVAAIMGYADDNALDLNQALTDAGIDSLMAVRIRNTVHGDFGVEPPVALLLQGASIHQLATHLITELGLAEQQHSDPDGAIRDRAQQRAAARQRAASRRKVGQRL